VDRSKVLAEARKQFALAKGGIEETGKEAVGHMKGLFGK
jgi:hypothetical protein